MVQQVNNISNLLSNNNFRELHAFIDSFHNKWAVCSNDVIIYNDGFNYCFAKGSLVKITVHNNQFIDEKYKVTKCYVDYIKIDSHDGSCIKKYNCPRTVEECKEDLKEISKIFSEFILHLEVDKIGKILDDHNEDTIKDSSFSTMFGSSFIFICTLVGVLVSYSVENDYVLSSILTIICGISALVFTSKIFSISRLNETIEHYNKLWKEYDQTFINGANQYVLNNTMENYNNTSNIYYLPEYKNTIKEK